MTRQRKTGADSGAPFEYVWHWKNRLPGRFGQRCRVLLQRGNGLCWIEFEKDGWRTYCSPFALRRFNARRDFAKQTEQLSLEGFSK